MVVHTNIKTVILALLGTNQDDFCDKRAPQMLVLPIRRKEKITSLKQTLALAVAIIKLQLPPNNPNLLGESRKVRVTGVSSYRG